MNGFKPYGTEQVFLHFSFCRAGWLRFVIGLIESINRVADPGRPPCIVAATAVEVFVPDPALDDGFKAHQTDVLAARTRVSYIGPKQGQLSTQSCQEQGQLISASRPSSSSDRG